MLWSDIKFDPPKRILRQFAGLWVAFFGGIACWQYFARDAVGVAAALAALALTVGPLGLVWPSSIRWVYVGWMIVAFPIGWTISKILMAVVFFGVFTPVGLLLRATGRDPLTRRRRPDGPTYWEPKPQAAGPQLLQTILILGVVS